MLQQFTPFMNPYDTFPNVDDEEDYHDDDQRLEPLDSQAPQDDPQDHTRIIRAAMRHSQVWSLFCSKLFLCWISTLLIVYLITWHSVYTPPGVSTQTTTTSPSFAHSPPTTTSTTQKWHVPWKWSHHPRAQSSGKSTPQLLQLTGLYWGDDDKTAGENLEETKASNPPAMVVQSWNASLVAPQTQQQPQGGGSLSHTSTRRDGTLSSHSYRRMEHPRSLTWRRSSTLTQLMTRWFGRSQSQEFSLVHYSVPQQHPSSSSSASPPLHSGLSSHSVSANAASTTSQEEGTRFRPSRHEMDQEQYLTFTEPQPIIPTTEASGMSALVASETTYQDPEQPSTTTTTTASPDQASDGSSDDQDEQDDSTPQVKNPAVYGWTPSAFPNPMTNPIRCAIAYLPQFMDHPPPSRDNGEMISPMAISLQQQQQSVSTYNEEEGSISAAHPLRLCDPDWVLGGSYLEQIAVAMNNFTTFFGKEHHDEMVQQREQELQEQPNHHYPRLRPQSSPIWVVPWADLALATARKMDLTAVLRDSSYYAYEDEDDMVNDAAQLFAHGLHDAWWPTTSSSSLDENGDNNEEEDDALVLAENGILIFLSIQDRVCFICTGPAITPVLPWWRLDHIITSMKPALRDRDFGAAILEAVANLSAMLQSGPPSMMDRLHDFCSRFGVVILFATFTFFFGAWGEYRDRRKRFQFAEERSQLKGVDREKACLLQQGYKTTTCPICLEPFLSDKATILSDHSLHDEEDESNNSDLHTVISNETEEGGTTPLSLTRRNRCGNPAATPSPQDNKGVDSYGIPLLGADGKRIKMLRCGHIFCDSCWRSWVHCKLPTHRMWVLFVSLVLNLTLDFTVLLI